MSEFQHLILMQVRSDADPTAVERALAAISSLTAIEGVLSVDAGADCSVEGVSDGFTHGVVARFADEATRVGFREHPDHLAVAPLLEPLLERVVVLDIPVP